MNEFAIPSDIDDRLRNWARWARVRHWHSSCGSVEKFYQAKAGATMQDVSPFQRADLWDAWEIERTWRLKLPTREKLVLKACYIGPQGKSTDDARRIERTMAKKVGVPRQQWHSILYAAAMMVKDRAKPLHLVRVSA